MAYILGERVILAVHGTKWLDIPLAFSRNAGSSARLMQQTHAAAVVDDKPDMQSSADASSATNVRPASEIPGPKSYPFFGSILSIVFSKDFDKKNAQNILIGLVKKYGDIVCVRSPTYPPVVLLNNPDDCEIAIRNTMENPIRLGFFALDKVRKDAAEYFENKGGILVEQNDEWKRIRSRVQTPMMRRKNVTAYLPEMDQVTLEFMDRIADLQEKYGEMPADFQTELYKWALESVSLVALNRRMGCLEPDLSSDSGPMKLIHNANKIFDALNETEHGLQFWRIFPTAAYKQLQKSHAEFLRIADQNIRQTEAALLTKSSSNDSEELTLMEKLLLTPGLSRKDVVTLILDMLFAGIDTTSHALGFTLYLLARNPKCQAKLQEEVDSVLGDLQGPITTNHLARLSYLKAVVKESLRIFPLTVGTVRTLEKDLILSGYLVPKGYAALFMGLTMGHDERNFPRAKEFIPERWLRDKPLGPIHPYSTLPFGVGTRMCVGRRIAEQELYTFLARVMQRFSVDYKYQDIDILSRLVYVPSQPLRFNFSKRQ